MKKCWILVLLCLLLAGCGGQETFEMVNDLYDLEVVAPLAQLQIALPEDFAVPTMQSSTGDKIYLCDGYTVAVQTLYSGNLDETLRQITGFDSSRMTVMKTKEQNIDRYEYVWSAAGEGGDHVGRGVVLDDGAYHYAVTVMADFETAGDLAQQWENLLSSVKLVSID